MMIHDVIVVGAGASGIGYGVVLRDLGIEKFLILDREHTGASFDRWPEEMRFITPSFTSNAFGLLDLNAVTLNTSPAFTLNVEHPTGHQYANYLRSVQKHYELPVRRGVHVEQVEVLEQGFRLHTSRGRLRARFVIWATGEFQFPDLNPFRGAELCLHTSKVNRWADIEGDEVLVIDGYESGADAAVHLSALFEHLRFSLAILRSPCTAIIRLGSDSMYILIMILKYHLIVKNLENEDGLPKGQEMSNDTTASVSGLLAWILVLIPVLVGAVSNAQMSSTNSRQTPESGTSTDIFVMPGSDFVRPGLAARMNLNIGIGHTFNWLKRSPVGNELTLCLHL